MDQNEANVHEHPTATAASLEERLAAARERKRAAAARREALAREAEALAEVEAMEREALDEEAIASAEEEHGAKRIAVVRTEVGAVIVKVPHPAIYKRFRDRGETKTKDLDALVRKSLVHPDAARFDTMLEAHPAILDRAANSVVELAGFRTKENSGK